MKKCFIMHLKVIIKIDVFMQKVERLEPVLSQQLQRSVPYQSEKVYPL